MIDRKTFFDRVRAEPFGGFLSGSQVTGIGNILDEAEKRGVGDPRLLAYRLATVFHETAKAMIPVREAGGEAYLKAKPYYPWVGMGLVQVTWEANAKKFGATKPEDLMSWPVALKALFDGMDDGVFTGRKLGAYFTDKIDDPAERPARHQRLGQSRADRRLSRAVPRRDQGGVHPRARRDPQRDRHGREGPAAAAKPAIAPVVALPHLPPKTAPRTGLAGLWDRLTGKA